MFSRAGSKEGKVAKRLLSWWKRSGREYPWREESNPFRVLVAEMLLQRTKADQVLAVYPLFIERFPEPHVLGKARQGDIEIFFRRLGLIWRAKKMWMLGRTLLKKFNGRVPDTHEELLSLPGVGEYVADAVLASAFGENVVAVDANVCRIIGRLFDVKARGEARRDPKFREIAQRMMPGDRAKEFNWAMIDFAALVCTPRNPKCATCPVKNMCLHAVMK